MTPQKPNPTPQGPLQIGQIFIWQYEILQLLGSGGHAFVYRARHRFLGHMVAIKVLHRAAGVSLEMLRRGQAEAQIEFQLKHPGIVSVLDGGIDNDGLLYIVMELLQGRSMRDALIELGRLHVIEVLGLGAKVARAIEVAHRAGVVHRDLKPENLFFTRDGIKVIDFGIAKIDDAAGWQTQKDMVMGTAYYLSPEQVMAQLVTPRSDIYALGTIMLEALLGQPPVLRQVGGRPLTFKLLTRIIVTEQLPPLNEIDPRVPAYVDRLLARATAKRPEERFASMGDFADACEACARTLEAELVQRGVSLSARELWRKTPSASGVETIGTPSSVPLEHDTSPASRPPFFGGLSSSTATVVPKSKPTAQAEMEDSRGAASSKPTVFNGQTGANNTTAPLGSPRSRREPAVLAPSSTPAPPRSAAVFTAPAQAEAPASTDEVSAELETQEENSSPPFAPLLWGVAIGIVVFGVGAFFVLRPKAAAQVSPHAVTTKVLALPPSVSEAVAPLPAPANPAVSVDSSQAAAVPHVTVTREPKPAGPRLPPRATLSKESPPAPPAAEGRSTIF